MEKIDKLAREIIQEVLKKYHKRGNWDRRSLSKMVEQEIKGYNEKVREIIEDKIYKILGELYTPFSENPSLAISPVVLSDMLYKNGNNLSKEVTKILDESIKAKETLGVIAKKLYEGYGFKDKEVLDAVNVLPKYIRNALKKGDSREVMKQIEKLKTKPLRIAYKGIFRKLDEMNAEALDKAMKTAYHEKMRYYAKRIADTETHRALMSKRAYEYLNDENVKFVKFTMSSAHPKVDICDFYANLDIGYGRGIVPKKEMRTLGLHPHCHCIYAPYYRKVKGKKKPWKDAVNETMSKFSKYEQKEIVSTRAMLERFKNGEDIEKIFNTIRPKYPIKRYAEIFKNIKIKNKSISLSLGFGKKVDEYLRDIRTEAKQVINKLDKPSKITLYEKKTKEGSYYSAFFKHIAVDNIDRDITDGGAKQTFLHEYGHHIDRMLGIDNQMKRYYSNNKKFIEARKKDAKILSEKYKDIGVIKYFKERWKDKPYLRSCSDVFDALTGGLFKDKYGMWGHGRSYFKKEDNKMTEIFAQMFRAWAGSEKEWKEMKEVFPNMSKYFETLMLEVIK